MHTIQKLRAQLQKNWRCPISKRCSIWAMWRAMSRRWRDRRVTRRFLGRWQTSKTRRWRWLIMATKTSRLPFGDWGAGVVPKGCACRPCASPMAFGSCDRSWRARKPIFASFCAISDSNGPKIRRIITIFIRETAFDTRFYRILCKFRRLERMFIDRCSTSHKMPVQSRRLPNIMQMHTKSTPKHFMYRAKNGMFFTSVHNPKFCDTWRVALRRKLAHRTTG